MIDVQRPPLRERDVVRYLVKRVKANGGQVRRVQWIGRRAAPDLRVWLPGVAPFWVEAKAPGKKPTIAQQREHLRMIKYGERVWVVASPVDVDLVMTRACA